jgi:hypothetical protein
MGRGSSTVSVGMISLFRRSRYGVLLSLCLLIFLASTQSASADEVGALPPAPEEVAALSRLFGLSSQDAAESAELQATETQLPEEVEETLGGRYAGIWFDGDAGEFVVPVISRADERAITADLPTPATDYRTEMVTTTWAELESAQDAVMSFIQGAVPATQPVKSYLDAESDRLVVEVPESLPTPILADLRGVLDRQSVGVTLDEVPAGELRISDLEGECDPLTRYCGPPLRGGAWWDYQTGLVDHCSIGYPVIGNQYGNRFMLTAGHCVEAKGEYEASYQPAYGPLPGHGESPEKKVIGPLEAFRGPLNKAHTDWALFNANGSYFDPGTGTARIAAWGEGENYEIFSEGSSYMGQVMCHSGATTGASCGKVTETDVSFETTEREEGTGQVDEHFTGFGPICAEGGDSGGPVYSGHTAFGIFTSATIELAECKREGFYPEITRIAEEAGVHIGTKVGTKPVVKIASNEPVTFKPTEAKAELHGTVDPNGVNTNYHFDYGTTTSYGQSSLGGNAGNGFQPVPETQTLEGLPGGTTYHYRLTAQSELGTVMTIEDHKFTTPAWPTASTGTAGSVTATSASLGGSVNPDGLPTTYKFEYGPTTKYGASTPATSAGSGASQQAVSATVAGLKAATTYHFRVVATNSSGTVYGADQVFNTTDGPPEVGPEVNSLFQPANTPRLIEPFGYVNPGGLRTLYYFEYGTTSSYGFRSQMKSVGPERSSGESVYAFIPNATGVESQGPFHIRLVAENELGRAVGADHVVTAPNLAPASTGLPATGESPGSATLNGSVDPEGQATTYYFEVHNFSTAFNTPVQSAGAGTATAAVHAAVSGLRWDGAPLTYVLVAENASGVTKSKTISFGPGRYPTASDPTLSHTASTISISGTINPEGSNATYRLCARTTPSHFEEQCLPKVEIGSGFSPVPYSHTFSVPAFESEEFYLIIQNLKGTQYLYYEEAAR